LEIRTFPRCFGKHPSIRWNCSSVIGMHQSDAQRE
jgi:hypothetical protein